GQGNGPFFQFDSKRLSIPPGKTYFAAYEDPYGKKQYYAYFSSFHGNSNDYNHFKATTAPPMSDCDKLGVWPYATSAHTTSSLQCVNKDSWQIIWAGADGKFGRGTDPTLQPTQQYYWNKNTAGGIAADGRDDQANFARGKLQYGE